MTLAVVGMGMVSPIGRSPAEHAFFIRAGASPAAPGAFLDEQGETINVAYCPWLGANSPIAERIRALGEAALEGALAPLRARPDAGPPGARADAALMVITPAPRPGMAEPDRASCESALARAVIAGACTRFTGEAGFFQALEQARSALASGAERAVAIVAVDSLVCPAALADRRRAATTPWGANLPRAAEGAAAVLVMTPDAARRDGMEVIATIHSSACLVGEPTDDNDVPVDGSAMAALLRGLPAAGGPIGATFGQVDVGELRLREWEIACARLSSAFSLECVSVCVESEIGCLGAASGAASLVHGAAAARQKAWPEGRAGEGPFAAWAISRDGTRGLALFTVAQPAERIVPPAMEPRADEAPGPVAPDMQSEKSGETPIVTALLPLFELPAPPAEPVVIDPSRAAPAPIQSFYAGVAGDCLERAVMLARHRDERPLEERADAEARLLAQVDAIAVAGATARDIVQWREDAADDDPWTIWAAAYLLGSLAGPEPLLAIKNMIEGLPGDATESAALAAEALVAAPHPGCVALARDLLASPRPIARSVGIELSSRRGLLDPEVASAALRDESPAVAAAAIRALARLEREGACAPQVRACLHHSDADVVWEAARATTLWGYRDAYLAVREGGPLAAALGGRALEILVMAGALDDHAAAQSIVSRLPPSADSLSAVARLGHPGAWAHLLHYLGDADLADSAEEGLVTLFGPIVAPGEEGNPSAWRDALARLAPQPGVRYRRGAPWSVPAVLAECKGGALKRREVERRLDELRARTGAWSPVDLGLFDPEATAGLAGAAATYARSSLRI